MRKFYRAIAVCLTLAACSGGGDSDPTTTSQPLPAAGPMVTAAPDSAFTVAPDYGAATLIPGNSSGDGADSSNDDDECKIDLSQGGSPLPPGLRLLTVLRGDLVECHIEGERPELAVGLNLHVLITAPTPSGTMRVPVAISVHRPFDPTTVPVRPTEPPVVVSPTAPSNALVGEPPSWLALIQGKAMEPVVLPNYAGNVAPDGCSVVGQPLPAGLEVSVVSSERSWCGASPRSTPYRACWIAGSSSIVQSCQITGTPGSAQASNSYYVKAVGNPFEDGSQSISFARVDIAVADAGPFPDPAAPPGPPSVVPPTGSGAPPVLAEPPRLMLAQRSAMVPVVLANYGGDVAPDGCSVVGGRPLPEGLELTAVRSERSWCSESPGHHYLACPEGDLSPVLTCQISGAPLPAQTTKSYIIKAVGANPSHASYTRVNIVTAIVDPPDFFKPPPEEE